MVILFSTNDETYTCTRISQVNLNLQQEKVGSRETEKPMGSVLRKKKKAQQSRWSTGLVSMSRSRDTDSEDHSATVVI